MMSAIALSISVLAIGLVSPEFLSTATTLTKKFDFSVLLVDVMLPFLLFAGAISVNVHELLKDRLTILLLASFGVLFSTFAVGTGLHWLVQQSFLGLSGLGLSYVDTLVWSAHCSNRSHCCFGHEENEPLFNRNRIARRVALRCRMGWCSRFFNPIVN